MAYEVDWNDSFFPRIIKTKNGEMTFAEAKKEIRDCMESRIEHSRMIIKSLRSIRAKHVEKL